MKESGEIVYMADLTLHIQQAYNKHHPFGFVLYVDRIYPDTLKNSLPHFCVQQIYGTLWVGHSSATVY